MQKNTLKPPNKKTMLTYLKRDVFGNNFEST